MKRLLCIIGCMNSGGAETFLMKVYRKLDRTKYQMDFCVNVKEECFYDAEIRQLGGRIFYVLPKTQNTKQFKKQLLELIEKEKYEYVLRLTSNAAGLMDVKIAKKAGAKICSARSCNSSSGNGLIAKMAHLFGRIFYGRYVDVRFAPADLAAAYTFGKKAYKSGMVEILHNGVDLSFFKYEEEAPTQVRREFNISDDVKIIGHVGRFMTQKNHRFLIEVFDEIHKRDMNTVLFLVGKGELEKEIRAQIDALGLSDSVVFTGVRSDIPRLMSAMDVFVMPSFFEGMPNTVIEAQATGLPCVISDTITREANITGLVSYLPLENPRVWAEAALSAINEERADTKSVFIENEYDIESVVKKFTKLVFGE